jgi:hypothetical protein
VKIAKLLIVELLVIIVIIAIVAFAIQGLPSFSASGQGSKINMYQEKEYSQGAVTMKNGDTASTRFNYTTYDPAILVVDLTFHQWQTPGNIELYCNGRAFANVLATPDKPKILLNVISVSGADWVQPSSASWPTIGSFFAYGNEITFVSAAEHGFAGTFDYKISIRGSR